MNEVNLRKLAYGLWNQPDGMPRFDMDNFSTCNSSAETVCGSIGCAIGWATHFVMPKDFGEDWCDFGYRLAGMRRPADINAWAWLFENDWTTVDNTPLGAAKRILWLIQFGLPDNCVNQSLGLAPLCYRDWEIVNESDAMDGSGLLLLDVSACPLEEGLAHQRKVPALRDGLHVDTCGNRAAAPV